MDARGGTGWERVLLSLGDGRPPRAWWRCVRMRFAWWAASDAWRRAFVTLDGCVLCVQLRHVYDRHVSVPYAWESWVRCRDGIVEISAASRHARSCGLRVVLRATLLYSPRGINWLWGSHSALRKSLAREALQASRLAISTHSHGICVSLWDIFSACGNSDAPSPQSP